ncbi:MAG: glycosyltransferase family 4 protein [Planctomycetaceae bacterium]|nr:glycosyltransferase family 4 protein [Planctomycetaceae bacterium]
MRILIIHQFFLGRSDSGGSRWNQFAKYWAAAGHDVTVLAGMVHYAKGTKPPEYKGRFIVSEQVGPRVTVLRCHVSESYNRNFMGRFWAYLSFTFSSLIAGILYAPRPDIIVATSPPLTVAPTMWMLSVLLGSPAVFEVRDLWPESAVDTGVLTSKPLIWLSYRIEALAYRRAALINVLTPAFVDALIVRKGVSPRRLTMIPNAADLDLMQPGPRDNHIRAELGLAGKFVISYFGAHGRANKVGQLLDAAELVRNSHPDIRFLLVGDGMEKPMLVEQAAQRKLDNVIFAPPVSKEQVGDYINASDACTAVLMKNETFKTVYPNKVFDYMCCRRPIIIGIDGAARKLIEEQAHAGLYAEPENPQAFVDAVLALKNDPDRAEGMGRSGWEYVVEHFDREKLAAKYLLEIGRVLEGCGS